MANNRTCYFCGRSYKYCPTCDEDMSKETWHILFCSEECKKLDEILASHTAKKIDTKEANRRIVEAGLENFKFHSEENAKYSSEYYVNNERHLKEILEFEEVKNVVIDNNGLVDADKDNKVTTDVTSGFIAHVDEEKDVKNEVEVKATTTTTSRTPSKARTKRKK